MCSKDNIVIPFSTWVPKITSLELIFESIMILPKPFITRIWRGKYIFEMNKFDSRINQSCLLRNHSAIRFRIQLLLLLSQNLHFWHLLLMVASFVSFFNESTLYIFFKNVFFICQLHFTFLVFQLLIYATNNNNSKVAKRALYGTFSQDFYFNLRRDHQKNFLWPSRLWVGRRNEHILGYAPKNYEKIIPAGKG